MRRWLFGLVWLASGCAAPVITGEVCEVTETSGILVGQTVWSGEVLVTADVVIPAGSRLVIRPGTHVRVRAAEGTKIEPEQLSSATEILVRGELEIQGMADAPVVIEPESGTPPAGEARWAGLILDGAVESRLRFVEIVGGEQGVWLIASSPLIDSVHIHHGRYGLLIQQQSSPEVNDSLIEQGEGGIYVWRGSRPLLRGNRVLDHAEEGLFVDAQSSPRLARNEIARNAIGVAAPEGLDLSPLWLHENGVDIRRLGNDAP